MFSSGLAIEVDRLSPKAFLVCHLKASFLINHCHFRFCSLVYNVSFCGPFLDILLTLILESLSVWVFGVIYGFCVPRSVLHPFLRLLSLMIPKSWTLGLLPSFHKISEPWVFACWLVCILFSFFFFSQCLTGCSVYYYILKFLKILSAVSNLLRHQNSSFQYWRFNFGL